MTDFLLSERMNVQINKPSTDAEKKVEKIDIFKRAAVFFTVDLAFLLSVSKVQL